MTISEYMSCPVCGGELLPHMICNNCGTDITLQKMEGLEPEYKCPACGSDAKVKFVCENCGSEFPYDLVMKKMADVEAQVKPKKKVHMEKSNLGELEKGLTNGITASGGNKRKGRGLTNGNGKGLTNGSIKSNGLTNGNGKGLTNGMGSGMTNGLGENKSKKPAKKSKGKRKKSIIPKIGSIAVVILLLLGALYVFHNPAPTGMRIDGDFSDWNKIPLRSEYNAPITNMDMVAYASKLSDGGLYMYLKSRGTLFSEEGSRIYAFVDADNNTNTGYRINGIGADYLCKAYGNSTKIVHAAYAYGGTGLEWNWSSEQALELPAAYENNQLEMAIYAENIQKDYRIAFYTSDSHGNYDISSANIGENPSLYFEAKRSFDAQDSYKFGTGSAHLMDITIFSTGGDVKIRSINMVINNIENVILSDSSGNTVSQLSGGQLPLDIVIGDGERRNYQIWGEPPSNGTNGTLMSIDGIGISTSTGAIVHRDVESFKAYAGKPSSIKIDGAFGDWTNIKHDPLNNTVPKHIDIREYSSSDDSNNLYFYSSVEDGMMTGVMVPEKYSEGKPTGNVTAHNIKPPETGEDILLVHVLTEDNRKYDIKILGKDGNIVSYSLSGLGISGGNINIAKDSKRLEGSVSLQAFGNSQIKSIWFEMSDWSKRSQRTAIIQPDHIMVSEGTRAVSGPFISNIRESNQTAKAIVITWVTDINSTGEVRYSTNSDLSDYSVKYDYRGSDYNTTLHYVKIWDLSPETTYYYEVISSTPDKTTIDDNGGEYYNFTTTKLLNTSSPQSSLWGRVNKSDGTTPAEGAIVFVNVTTSSGDESYPLSNLVANDSTWIIDMSNLISKNSGKQIVVNNGDSIHIEVEGGLMGTGSNDTNVTGDSLQYCGEIILGNPPVSAEVSFLKSSGEVVSSYIIGDNIYARVMDNDSSANDPSQIDTVKVTVKDPITGDSEEIELEETGQDTGIFVNFSHPIISVNKSTGVKNDGIISTLAGNYIYASYIDPLDGDSDTTNNEKTAQALMIGYQDQSIHFVDENGSSVDEYHIGDKIYILLTSSNTTAPKIYEIRESNQTAKAIVITWVTDINSTGEVRYSTNSDLSDYSVKYDYRGSDYNTTLHYVKIWDLSPETTYYYEVISSTPDKTTIDDNGGEYYNFTTTKLLNTSSPQSSLWGRVNKSDGTTPAEGAIVFVNVTTSSGDESYPLSNLVANDSTWIIDMSNLISKNSGKQIVVNNGDSIHIEVEGGLMGTGSNDTNVTGDSLQYCGEIILGQPYHLAPPTPGANQNPKVSENVTVNLRDPITGDFEAVVLNETGPNTSVFMNTWHMIDSSSGPVNANDSVMETGDRDTIEVSYYSLNDTAIMLNESKGLVSFIDSEGNDLHEYVVGDNIYVEVIDSNANVNSSDIDTIYVNVSNPSTGDWENISLRETGNDTGIFRNSMDILNSSSDSSTPDDGILETNNGDVINVTYTDADPQGYHSYDEATMISPILHINKTANKTTLSPGEEFYYTIVVSNTGLGAALNVEIIDVLPDNVTYINDTASADSTSHDGQRHTWVYNVLNSGDEIEFRIYVKVSDTAGNGTLVNNATANYTDSHNRVQPSIYATATSAVPEFGQLIIPIIFVVGMTVVLIRRNKPKRRR